MRNKEKEGTQGPWEEVSVGWLDLLEEDDTDVSNGLGCEDRFDDVRISFPSPPQPRSLDPTRRFSERFSKLCVLFGIIPCR